MPTGVGIRFKITFDAGLTPIPSVTLRTGSNLPLDGGRDFLPSPYPFQPTKEKGDKINGNYALSEETARP